VGQCPLQESNNNTLKLPVAGKNTFVNQDWKCCAVNFPDFDAAIKTFAGLNKVSSTRGPKLPLVFSIPNKEVTVIAHLKKL